MAWPNNAATAERLAPIERSDFGDNPALRLVESPSSLPVSVSSTSPVEQTLNPLHYSTLSFAVAIALALTALSGCTERGAYASARRTEVLETPADGSSLFGHDEFTRAITRLESKSGPLRSLRALEVSLYADKLVLQAQDPKNPQIVQQFEVRSGGVVGPVPVKLQGPGRLDDNLFPLGDANLDSIPELVSTAVRKVDGERGRARYVIVRRNLPTDWDVRIRVFVSSPKRDRQIDADATGRLIEQS